MPGDFGAPEYPARSPLHHAQIHASLELSIATSSAAFLPRRRSPLALRKSRGCSDYRINNDAIPATNASSEPFRTRGLNGVQRHSAPFARSWASTIRLCPDRRETLEHDRPVSLSGRYPGHGKEAFVDLAPLPPVVVSSDPACPSHRLAPSLACLLQTPRA